MARLEAIGMLLTFVSNMIFMIYQMNEKSEFLSGYIKEGIFIYQVKYSVE